MIALHPSAAISTMTAIPTISVFPAQAGNQPYYEVQSSLNEKLDTRMREYDGVVRISKIAVAPKNTGFPGFPAFAVFPAKAGNQCCYEVQSSLNAQLDTRMREYDGSTHGEAV